MRIPKVIVNAFEGIYIGPTFYFHAVALGKNKGWDDDKQQDDDFIFHDRSKNERGFSDVTPFKKKY